MFVVFTKVILCLCLDVERKQQYRGYKSQQERMEIFSNQIEKANENKGHIIILGDVNLCSKKWNDDDFHYKKVAIIHIDAIVL